MRVFLSGPMGSGKSTVGRALASRLGLEFVDLDEVLVAELGPLHDAFARIGEGAFREAEARAIQRISEAEEICVALGGGTVLRAHTRRVLSERGLLLCLNVPLSELTRRAYADQNDADAPTRPLLPSDESGIRQRLADLLEARAAAYAECDATVDGEGSTEDVVERLWARVQERPIGVFLGQRSYSVDIGAGYRARRAPGFEVADENTAVYATAPHVLRAGEAHKHIAAVESIWDAALEAGVERGGRLVAVGGGVVGDLTGFAAATLLRGVSFGLVATSVVSMVDSSVGGKTGFNRSAGKNLVGAFHQPEFVICDTETLATLPDEEYRAGFAEVVKSAWLAGDEAVARLERSADAILARDSRAVEEAVRMCIRLKAKVVSEDEREKGARAQLNLGHTVGHGLEAAAGLGRLSHGDAVSLGLCAAAELARRRGAMDEDSRGRLVALLRRLNLPTDYARRLSPAVERFIGADKKRSKGVVRFVVPGAPGEVRYEGLSPSAIMELVR